MTDYKYNRRTDIDLLPLDALLTLKEDEVSPNARVHVAYEIMRRFPFGPAFASLSDQIHKLSNELHDARGTINHLQDDLEHHTHLSDGQPVKRLGGK